MWNYYLINLLIVIDSKIPNIISRSRKLINVQTGFRVVDSLFPISSGQRELIIGDRQSGKSVLNISAIIQQISRNRETLIRKNNFNVIELIVKNVQIQFVFTNYYWEININKLL